MTWIPTERFLHGRLFRPFLPFDKHPTLKNPNFKNLYSGDEVYIFETKNGKWARGYSLTRPFPHDYTIHSVNLDDLPGLKIQVVVFPLKYVKVIEELPLNLMKVTDGYNNVSVGDTLAPTLKQLEIRFNEATNGLVHGARAVIPPLPFDSFTFAGDLVSEIVYAMNLLTSHIFALYSIGEFRLFNKLSEIYQGLDEIRVKLTHNTLTENEIQVAKETATFLLNKIPKKLALKAARLNEKSYDLDFKNTDISGYKAILARNAFSGALVSLDNASPSQLALNQELCALYPKFPINAHYNRLDFLLEPARNRKLDHEPPSHILVDFKSVSGSSSFQPSGFAGMIAYLYIRNTKKRLTEAFAVHTNSVDELVFVEKISAALFRNIPASEVENNRVYLVAVLTEEIDLPRKDALPLQITRVKKGVAAGVADITRIFSRNQGALASGASHQFSIKLYGSYITAKLFDTNKVENNGWGEAVDRIISGSNVGIAVNPRAEKLVVSVKEFKHQLTESEDYLDVKSSTNGHATDSKSAPIAKIKPIFFDPLAENYERIYLKMGKITFLDETGKDDLLTVEISAPNDPDIRFAKASNQVEKPTWQFVSTLSSELIGEIVKVNGIAKVAGKKTLRQDAIALTLYVNGVLVGTGEVMYRNGSRLVEYNRKDYYPVDFWGLDARKLPIAQVQIHTEYIGKDYNTEECIENIFQCERLLFAGSQGIDDLNSSLVDFCKLDIYHMVRFFPELLSSFFKIAEICLGNSGSLQYEMLLDITFKAVVQLLDTIFGKQDQYLYMFDTFVNEKDIKAAVGVFLLNKISEIFTQAQSNWNSMSRSVCRIVALLIKIALYPTHNGDSEHFMRALRSLFKSASFFVNIQSQALINDQVLIMELPDFVLAFEEHFNQAQLLDVVMNFIDSVGIRGLGVDEEQFDKNNIAAIKDHKIVLTKMLLIQRLFACKLSRNIDTMNDLVGRCVVWCMEVYLGPLDIEATRLASSVMNCVCDLLRETMENPAVTPICFSLVKHLGAISRTFIKYNKFTRSHDFFNSKRSFTQLFQNEYPFAEMICDSVVESEVLVEVLVELATVFVYMSKIGHDAAGPQGFFLIFKTDIKNDFFDPAKCTSNNGLNEDILTILAGIQLMRQGKYFPEDKWVSMYAMIAEGCLLALELLRVLMVAHFIPSLDEPDLFDRSLWGNYIKSLLKLCTLAPVSVEHLSTIPRKACHQITGSIRDRVADIVNELWDALAWDATPDDTTRFNLTMFGGYQVEFISNNYAIIQDLMLFALQRNSACQTVSVKIIWTIIVSEYILSDSIVDVERECLIGLHDVYYRTAYKPGVNEQLSFIERLKTTIRLDREDEAYPMMVKFILNLAGFLEVLNDLNHVPVGPEFEDDRTFHKLNINAYLKNANKPELFHSFISLMFEENIKKNDYIQAALSLELLASTYTWDHQLVLPASYRPKFPEQTSFERKETLIKMIAQNYIKGNSLERATDTYNELLEAYNEHTYDLKSFAYVHQKLAKLYLDLESSDKLSPSFYRVAYIGGGFPANIRGKEQIYEGLPFEHITSIHERLLKLYPGARIVTDDAHAMELKKKIQTGRYLHVNAVEPVNEISDKILNTSIGVRQYARNKNLRFFSVAKKIPGSTSVFDLWTEEVTYETAVSFPTLMKRSEIKNTTVVRLSPLENAIRTIINKNNELVQLESIINMAYREKSDYISLLNDLSRHLAGTVDSPVNGGVGQYRTFFLDPRYDGKPDYAYNIRLLRNLFHDLTSILNRCLHLHGKLVAPSMRPSHDALVELYRVNFKEEIEFLKINTDYDALVYNHVVTVAPPSKEKKQDNALTTALTTLNNSSLYRTVTKSSRASSNLGSTGLTGLSEPSTGFGDTKSKRTALNWRRGK